MNHNILIKVLAAYKFLINAIRIITGLLLFYFKGDLNELIAFLFKKEVIRGPNERFYNFILDNITNPSKELALLLASALIILSLIEIYLTIGLHKRNKNSAIGLFITTMFWIPLEILFVSKFLIVNKLKMLMLDAVILLALLKIILSMNKNRKNQ